MASPRFRCDRCGICCRSIGGIPQLRQYDRGDGVCCHLTDANLCDMYESRPEVCNVEKMYSRFAAEMSMDEYISMMEESCECLKESFLAKGRNQFNGSDVDALLKRVPSASLEGLATEVGLRMANLEDGFRRQIFDPGKAAVEKRERA